MVGERQMSNPTVSQSFSAEPGDLHLSFSSQPLRGSDVGQLFSVLTVFHSCSVNSNLKMTIIVFLLDTSASMNQRVFLGGRPNLLDVAKSAVETFVKVRQRSQDSRGDRYMLLTFEEAPNNIKAGWKENLQTFMTELKNLQATGLTSVSQALRQTFDVLNINRMQHGIDTYGQGRCPFYLEPSIIVVITDGGQLCSNSGVTNEIKWNGTSPGVELTREPFRWDQRLFSLVLRMSGQPSSERETGLVPTDISPIDSWCEVTGGRSYSITTHRMLHQCIDSLVQKVQAGVVIHFEKYGESPPPIEGEKEEDEIKWQSCRRMIYVSRTNQKNGFAGGFWPIPESFWPEPGLPSLPPRAAHPNIKFTCVPHEPLAIENFPFDKYELEPSPLTQFILARKLKDVCWQVYLPMSSKTNTIGHPFGYLKASSNLSCVNLYVMPYNYTSLLPLLDDLLRIHRLKPTNEWKMHFNTYLSSMPPYYAGPLKRALLRIGAGSIAQSVLEENYLSYSVLNYLKKLKSQAKSEYERTCGEVGIRVGKEVKRPVGVNAFDVPREQLLEHLSKLRTRFFRPVQVNPDANNQPVAQMGNYQEYLKRQPSPLREIEVTPVRQHMFGNPFKIDKRMIVDEAEVDLTQRGGEINQGMPIRLPKRKPGPLPKDYVFVPKKNRPSEPSTPSPQSPQPLSPIIMEPIIQPEKVEPIEEPKKIPVVDFELESEGYVGLFGEDMTMEFESPVQSPSHDWHTSTPEHNLPNPPVLEIPEPEIVPVPSPPPEPTPPEELVPEPLIEANNVAEIPKPPPALIEDDEKIHRNNFNIRVELHKEIRRPRVRVEVLLNHLKSLAGSQDTKLKFVKNLEREAMRFRRKKLASIFQAQIQSMGLKGLNSINV